MMQKVLLIGNLGKNPEAKTFENGNKVANFSVATSESYKDRNGDWQQKTEWHNIQAWGALATKAATLAKGDTVFVEGKLSTRKWQDKNGNDRYSTDLVASYFRKISRGGNDSQPQQKPYNYDTGNQDPSGHTGPDDLPF